MDRTYRIALTYLAKDEALEKQIDETKVRSLAKKSIKESLETLLFPFLRQLPVSKLFEISNYVLSDFSPTKVPTDYFSKSLINLKIKILESLLNAALLDKDSLTDVIVDYVKANPDMTDTEIETHIRTMMTTIKRNALSYLRRIEQLLP